MTASPWSAPPRGDGSKSLRKTVESSSIETREQGYALLEGL
jgi:hypothetical protein